MATSMIITKLKGGLGNQLFQYAVGLRLAEIHNTDVKIDISFFKTHERRKYSLWAFSIQENFASSEEVNALTHRRHSLAVRILRRVLKRPSKLAPTYIREKHFHFDPDILDLPDSVYLDGYWQSEKYFADIAGIIRQEFTVKAEISRKNKELGEEIVSCESVSVHIRRGDYLLPPYNATHGTCSLGYYLSCAECLSSRVNNPQFFMFSDDSDWARHNMKLPDSTVFVRHNETDKDYEDLRLMAQCKHHIIANSTFSWWAAWLSQNPDKLVYAPAKWFTNDAHDMRDLIPEDWIRI